MDSNKLFYVMQFTLVAYGFYHLIQQKIVRVPICQKLGLKLVNQGINVLMCLQNWIPRFTITWPNVSSEKPPSELILQDIQLRLVQGRQTIARLNINSDFHTERASDNSPESSRLLIDINYQLNGRNYLLTLNNQSTSLPNLSNEKKNIFPWMKWIGVEMELTSHFDSTITSTARLEMKKAILLKMNQYLGPRTDFHQQFIQLNFNDLDLPNLSDLISFTLESDLGDIHTFHSNMILDGNFLCN